MPLTVQFRARCHSAQSVEGSADVALRNDAIFILVNELEGLVESESWLMYKLLILGTYFCFQSFQIVRA